MRVLERIRNVVVLTYLGFRLMRYFVTGYLTSVLNSVLWFLLVYAPVITFTTDPARTVQLFLPGFLAYTVVSWCGWAATEYLRHFLYEGLLDLYRECGLGVREYLVSTMLSEGIVIPVLTYIALYVAAVEYAGLPLTAAFPRNWLYAVLALVLALPPAYLYGNLVALFFTLTPAGNIWTNLIQMTLLIGTVIPPTVSPRPELVLLNPATTAAELMRWAYGTTTIAPEHMLVAAPVTAVVSLVLGHVAGSLCDKYIAKHGVRYVI